MTRCEIILQNYLKTRDIDLYTDYKIRDERIYYKYNILFCVYSNIMYYKYGNINNINNNIIKNLDSFSIYYYNNKHNLICTYFNKNIKIIKTKIWKYYNCLFKMYKKIWFDIININEIHFKYFYSKIEYSIYIIKYYSSYMYNSKYININMYSIMFLFIFDIFIYF